MSGEHILIVEDSGTQAEQLAHRLETRGYHVAVAANGEEALAAARKRRPRLVIANASRRTVGLAVDEAVGTIEQSIAEIVDSSAILPGIEYIEGVVKREDGNEENALDVAMERPLEVER
jgi:CheY-like chemotaxis protein